ncbi:MAG: PEP-CTERM sorting domain-containing protein [bacterium]|nr:PEP-CTERM sorting domain-containing protein [bacterium]
MTWSIDGLEIGTLDAAVGDAFNTDGSATIGYMDIFVSVSDAPQFSFGLVDNFSVTAVPEPSSSLVLLFSGLLGGCWRYRRSA